MKNQILEKIRQHPKLVVATDYEIGYQRDLCHRIRFQNGEKGGESQEDSLWICLRILHRNRPGVAVTTFATDESLGRLVEQAFISAEQSQADAWFRFPLWRSRRELDPESEGVPPDFFQTSYPDFSQKDGLFEERYETWDRETALFRRSEKVSIQSKKKVGTRFWSYSFVNATGETRQLRESFSGWENPKKRLESFGRSVQLIQDGKDWDGDWPEVFSLGPRAMIPLMGAISQWFLANQIQNARSPLTTEDLGKEIFSPQLSIVDDGQHPGHFYSAPFDLEGSATQKTFLVRKGVLSNFLYDSYTAARDNRLSTGNRLRFPYELEPQLGVTTFYIEPGIHSLSQIWSQIGSGIYLDGWDEVSISDSNLELRGNAFGWWVEKGLPHTPIRVKDLRFDLKKMLTATIATAQDILFFGNLAAPSIFFRNIPLRK